MRSEKKYYGGATVIQATCSSAPTNVLELKIEKKRRVQLEYVPLLVVRDRTKNVYYCGGAVVVHCVHVQLVHSYSDFPIRPN